MVGKEEQDGREEDVSKVADCEVLECRRVVWMLGNVEVCYAHYLVENEISWHPTHILSSAMTLMTLVVLPAKQQ
jgi:hypothetical protein